MNALESVNSVHVSMQELVKTTETILARFRADTPADAIIAHIARATRSTEPKALAIYARMQALVRVLAAKRSCKKLRSQSEEEWARALFVCAATQPLVRVGEQFAFELQPFLSQVRQFVECGSDDVRH